jgi:hypothetical protein
MRENHAGLRRFERFRNPLPISLGRRTAPGGRKMESDLRYYSRRAAEEASAASRAVTDQARERRRELADKFWQKAQAVQMQLNV